MTTRGHHGLLLNGGGGGGGGSAQSFVFDSTRNHPNVTLSNANKTASTVVGSGHYYASATNPKNSGKWIYEFVVDSLVSGVGNIAVGLVRYLGGVTSIYPGDAGSAALWTRQSVAAARFYFNTQSGFDTLSTSGNLIAQGDVVSVTVDFATETVAVYRNGTLVYSKVVTGIDTSVDSYVPNVKLWGGSGNPTTVSIPANITHPVSGFSPWA